MPYFKTHQQLEEVNGDIPDESYFCYFADIAIRAREILKNKTPKDIFESCQIITFLIDQRRIKEVDFSFENPIYAIDSMKDSSIPLDYLSDNRILRICLAERGIEDPFAKFTFPQIFGEDDNTGWHVSEFMAVHAISKLADAIYLFRASSRDVIASQPDIRRFRLKARWRKMSSEKIQLEMLDRLMRIGGKCALEAMQAVNDAERLQTEYSREMDRRDRQSLIAGELNTARHKQTYEAKKSVLLDWESRSSDFQSAAKAGNHYAEWLQKKGLKAHEPTTITSWIRAHAKVKGMRLR